MSSNICNPYCLQTKWQQTKPSLRYSLRSIPFKVSLWNEKYHYKMKYYWFHSIALWPEIGRIFFLIKKKKKLTWEKSSQASNKSEVSVPFWHWYFILCSRLTPRASIYGILQRIMGIWRCKSKLPSNMDSNMTTMSFWRSINSFSSSIWLESWKY